jgi:hypothetical protein
VNSKLYVYTTESFEGAQTSKNAAKETITVDGTVYTVGTGVSDGTDAVAMADFANSAKTDNTYYLDQFGFVVKTTAASASSDFALILDVYAKLDTTIDGSTPAVQVRAVLEDGTVGTYTVALEKVKADDTTDGDYKVKNVGTLVYDKSGKDTAAKVNTKAQALDAKIYGYTLNGTTITLENAFVGLDEDTTSLMTYKASNKIVKNATSVVANEGTALLTKDTAIVVVDTDTNVAKVYNGTADLGKNELADFKAVVAGKSQTLAQAEVVFVEVKGGLVAATDNYAFVDVSEGTENLNGEDVTYTYTAALGDGETIELVSEEELSVDGLYKYSAANEVSNEDLLQGVSGGSADQYIFATVTVSGDMMNTGASTYYDISEADVVYVDADQTLDEVTGNQVFFVVTVVDGVPSLVVESIFVYAAPAV